MRVFLLASLALCVLSQSKRPFQQGSARFAPFDAVRLQNQVESALSTVRQLLNTTRNPAFPTQVPHVYEDKYLLADILTNTEIAAQLNTLESLGLPRTNFAVFSNWVSSSQTINLEFHGVKSCVFARSEANAMVSTSRVRTKSDNRNSTEQISTTVTEFVWSLLVNWEIMASAFKSAAGLPFASRNASFEVRTTTNVPPSICSGGLPTLKLDVTWLFANIGPRGRPNFAIDRTAPSTFTPLRNRPVQDALEFAQRLFDWSAKVETAFETLIFPLQSDVPRPALSTDGLFVPVLPLLESSDRCSARQGQPTCVPDVVLSAADMNALLQEQLASLQTKTDLLATSFPVSSARTSVSSAEARVVVLLRHARQLGQAYSDSVTSIEAMLYSQLVAAIGKEVNSAELTPFMDFNNELLFKSEFKPRDFSISVRRPEHYPDGVVSVERVDGQSVPRSVKTVSRMVNSAKPMSMSIGRGTILSLVGKRFVHGSVFHQFSDQAPPRLQLNARALQFASFVLVVGSLVAENEFRPESACLVMNRDEFLIPLLLNPIPTPRAFRDAVASLSSEQREFATRIREMQLSSTVFAFAVIQVKPQLEVLLKLPPDSLTKELVLIPALMQLFVDFQVPSDLISYAGDMNASTIEKIGFVRGQAQAVTAILQQIEATERTEAAKRQYIIQPLPEEYSDDYDYEAHPQRRQAEEPVRRQAQGPPAPTPLPSPLSKPILPGKAPKATGKFTPAPTFGGKTTASPSVGKAMAPTSGKGKNSGPAGLGKLKVVVPNDPLEAPPPDDNLDDLLPLLMLPLLSPRFNPPPPVLPRPTTPPSSVITSMPQRPSIVLSGTGSTSLDDFTLIPKTLTSQIDLLDAEHASRFVMIKPGPIWSQTVHSGLIAAPKVVALRAAEQDLLRKKAFDLLDSLSKSGALPLEAEVHAMFATTHYFDKSLVETVIQDNENPIAALEKSTLILSSSILNRPVADLLAPDQTQRVQADSPKLFQAAASS